MFLLFHRYNVLTLKVSLCILPLLNSFFPSFWGSVSRETYFGLSSKPLTCMSVEAFCCPPRTYTGMHVSYMSLRLEINGQL